MRLKSIEIKGFKSFADRTIINFSEDVIGIVGSNGCGKSNIVDAIRWVLGEQKTSQLRSESMTSVIFNGTKGRKSSSMAEVSLVFINDKGILPIEYQEVSIQRTLYKDGTSAYHLNGIKCRLKDISNLLVDTGMGSDSYAIIALGMVDELLQDKDNSRLKLFEQAAGISKYKARKKETLSKLKGTEADLSRVEDLLFEIKKNLKSLERQAKRAKRYFELKTEYRRLSLELSYFKIAECKHAYKQLNDQLDQEQQRKKTLQESIQKLEQQVDNSREQNLEEEQQLARCQKQLNHTTNKIKNKENEKKILTQKSIFLEQNNEKLDERIRSNAQKLTQTDQKLNQISQQLDEEYKTGKALHSQLGEAKELLESIKLQHSDSKKELDTYLQQQQALQAAVFEEEKKLAFLQNKKESIHKNKEHLTSVLNERTSKNKGLADSLEHYRTQQEAQEETIKQLMQQESKRKDAVEQKQVAIEEKQEELSSQNRRLDAKINEQKLLKSLVEKMEGFSASIKFLSKDKTWTKNAPLLSDIFYCEPMYRTAIENFLDPYLSYFVVQNAKEAYQAFHLLEQHQKGKASFFVLDQLKQSTDEADFEHVGVAALDVLSFDDKYQSLAQHLLGKVVVVAKKEAIPTKQKSYTWLTIDGKYIQGDVMLSGGSVGAFEGKKLGRKKNLELLEQQINQLQNQTSGSKTQLNSLKTDLQALKSANFQSKIQQQQQALATQVRQVITLKSKLDSFNQFEQETAQRQEALEQQLAVLNDKEDAYKTNLSHLQKRAINLRETVSEKDAYFQNFAARMSESSTEYNRKHIEQVRHQNAMSALEKELDFCHRQLKELNDQRKKDEEILGETGGDLSSAQAGIQSLNQELQDCYASKKKDLENLVAAEKIYFNAKGAVNETEKTLKGQQKQYTQVVDLIAQLDRRFNDVKLQLTSIAERLNVEFEIKINDLVNENPNPEFEEAVLESNVGQLRARLHNYGPINPMAIEAYDEILERNQLIEDQKNDLVEAKDNLLATIAEIERKATERFLDAFNKVRGYFIEVFRSLFHQDDTCDLKLSHPNSPLDSKIEIIAQPKGKRPLSINQLSGGEKTLTATALLFALYLLKPAPFCIFDEVDAPLDDANIAKFNNIVKDFSANSQFVIVTHNKKTMESVDIMYGVTMVRGISRVVPVDFRALETLS